MSVGEHRLKVYNLSDGTRLIDAEDFNRYCIEAMGITAEEFMQGPQA